MANTLTNVKDAGSIICKMIAGRVSDSPKLINVIDKEPAESFDGKNGFKSGDSVSIHVPPLYTAGTSFDITSTIQDIKSSTVSLPLDIESTVGITVDSLELAKEVDFSTFMRNYGDGAADAIASAVESRVIEKLSDAVYHSVGTAGSELFEFDTFAAAKEKLDLALAPEDGRYALLNSSSMRKATNSAKGYLNPQTGIGKMYESGMIKDPITGFDFMRNELLNVHTNGNDVVFEVRTTVSTEGQSTLVVEGLTTTTGTVKKGTVFTVAGVYDVHPQTKTTRTQLKQFVVTADATADGSGYATLSISPAMYTSASGSLQNIASFPQDGDAITPVGAASSALAQNLAFHKSAFRFVSVPLEMPNSAELIGQETVNGITIAMIRDFDNIKRRWITRFDFLGGACAVRPEWATRITA